MQTDPRLAALGGDPSEAELDAQIAATQQQIAQLATEQDQMMMEQAPVGDFSKPALDRFTKSLNTVLEAFGAPAVEPPAEPEFTPSLTRAFLMVSQAVSDAIAQDVLDPELQIDPSQVVDDQSLRQVGARLGVIAKDKNFRRWLKEAPAPAPAPEVEAPAETSTEPTELSDADIEALFTKRA